MNRFVLADPRLCIGCYTCMPACVVVHREAGLQAYPRLTVTHTAHGTMPVQCRHCDDAPCAKVCPVAAITHREGMIFLNETVCIGCKMCAIACPFGAITPHGSGTDSQAIPTIPYLANGEEVTVEATAAARAAAVHPLLAWTAGERSIAVKCDLCHFLPEGPECVRVCPTKALCEVTEADLTREIEGRRQKATAEVGSLPSLWSERQA
ncbi:4Fe-4S dicluster domain-containing protein [Azospirillum halopraeferens]|uniref:4Fe-4S dicluster domain-containing protein n=1 Tax=Azospirillum halopraeferens TaxID=34010 RepID=UPI00042970CD|nr:4Fe-4S dicluster domain-containing protein [Azospirillum halopraeferens]